jgi:hypothetical protein
MVAEEYQRLGVPVPLSSKIQRLLDGLVRLVA